MTEKMILDYFAKLILDELGIVFSPDNYYQLESRLSDVAEKLEFSSIEEFHKAAIISLDNKAMQLLMDIATNNETSFFRDANIFEAISDHIEEGIKAYRLSEPIKIWSVASSTGQEPYSLAMTLEELRAKSPLNSYSILASDVSERVLQQAKNGIYQELEIGRGLSKSRLERYFSPCSDGRSWQVNYELRQKIDYRNINLLKPWNIRDQFDIILCRNVLIYQNIENKKSIIANLAKNLKENGLIIFGGAESLVGLTDLFDVYQVNDAIFYQKRELKLTGT